MKNLIFITCVILTGCTSVRKISRDIEAQKSQLLAMRAHIDSLDQKRAAKLAKGGLDEKTDSITRAYIKKLTGSITARLQRFDAISNNSNKKEAIAYLNSAKAAYKKELKNILFFDDLFESVTFSRLNTAAFFAPGQYMPEESTYKKVRTIMEQIIGDAIKFSNKYPSRKLKAMFVVIGYADEENVLPGSELYKNLARSVSSSSPDRKSLNRELSLRRATAIKDILERQYLLLNNKPASNLSARFLAIGKGETLPAATITNYKPIDERRRVVLLYWSMVPEL